MVACYLYVNELPCDSIIYASGNGNDYKQLFKFKKDFHR